MKKNFLITILILLTAGVIYFFQSNPAQTGLDHNVSGYAWSENIGWVSFNSLNDESQIDYGVNIDPLTGYFSGYAWSENLGWISFNRSDTGSPPSNDPCPDGNCIAKIDDPSQLGNSNVKVLGWARVLSVKDNPQAGGWNGWIRFDHGRNDEVYIDANGDFHGFAWSNMVLGWLSFNSSDSNAGGADYKVTIRISLINQKPLKPTLSFVPPDYCKHPVNLFLSWTYQDNNNDNQSAYHLQVERISAPATTVVDCTIDQEIESGSNSRGSSYIRIVQSPTPNLCDYPSFIGDIEYGKEFRLRVRVKDSNESWSDWSDWQNITPPLPERPYPYVNFTPLPKNPNPGEKVIFNNQSSCYSSPNSCLYFWDLGDGTQITTTTSIDIIHTYNQQREYTVTLTVRDNSMAHPHNNAECSHSEKINVKLSQFRWTEVAPF